MILRRELKQANAIQPLDCTEFIDSDRTWFADKMIEYCQTQLSHCRWQDEKPPCKFCTSHCYAKKQREQVRLIMRWMGPRMVLYAPLEVVRHLLKKG